MPRFPLKPFDILVGTLLFTAVALAGGDSSGGGFAFSSTSDKLLDYAISDAVSRVEHVDFACLNRILAGERIPQVEPDALIAIIRTVHREYDKEESRANPKGQREPLSFDYGTDQAGRGYIEALRTFFLMFAATDPTEVSPKLLESVSRRLLHEGAHWFGLNELQAAHFSRLVLASAVLSNDCYSLDYYAQVTYYGKPYLRIIDIKRRSDFFHGFGNVFVDFVRPEKETFWKTVKDFVNPPDNTAYIVSSSANRRNFVMEISPFKFNRGKVRVEYSVNGGRKLYPVIWDTVELAILNRGEPIIRRYSISRGPFAGSEFTIEYGLVP